MAESNKGCGFGGLVVVAVLAWAIYAYTDNSGSPAQVKAEEAAVSASPASPSAIKSIRADVNPIRGDFDEDRALDAANDVLSGETYEAAVGAANCSEDCSGHEAGWKWAQEGNDCSDETSSFSEGCRAFTEAVEARVEAARAAYEKGDDTFTGG